MPLNKVLLVSILMSLTFSALAQNKLLQEEINLTRDLISKGDFQQAIVHANNARSIDEDDIDALEVWANAYLAADNSKEALRVIEQEILEQPNKAEYWYIRGVIYLQREKYSKALDDFASAAELDMPAEKRFKVFLNIGAINLALGDFEQSETNFNKALELNPNSSTVYHSLGMLEYENREYDKAVGYFIKSLQIDPSNAITHYNLGMTYFRLDDSDNACYHFNKSCGLGHKNACRLFLMQCANEINVDK